MFHANLFCYSDLHVIDVIAIPQWFEDRVGKARDQNILHGLFAEIMVDAIDLILVQCLVNLLVEFASRGKVGAERFFDDDAPPAFAWVAAVFTSSSAISLVALRPVSKCADWLQ